MHLRAGLFGVTGVRGSPSGGDGWGEQAHFFLLRFCFDFLSPKHSRLFAVFLFAQQKSGSDDLSKLFAPEWFVGEKAKKLAPGSGVGF